MKGNTLTAKKHEILFSASLSYHLRMVCPFSPFRCEKCKLTLPTSNEFLKHMRLKHRIHAPFACLLCLACYQQRPLLQNHIKIQHMGVYKPKKPKSSKQLANKAPAKPAYLFPRLENKSLKTYDCTLCARCFGSQMDLTIHMESVHANQEKKPIVVSADYFNQKKQIIPIPQSSISMAPKVLTVIPSTSQATSTPEVADVTEDDTVQSVQASQPPLKQIVVSAAYFSQKKQVYNPIPQCSIISPAPNIMTVIPSAPQAMPIPEVIDASTDDIAAPEAVVDINEADNIAQDAESDGEENMILGL